MSELTVSERIAKYAATQWREMMTRGKVFDQLGDHRPDYSPQERYNEVFGSVLVDRINDKVVTPEKLDALVEALAKKIVEGDGHGPLTYMTVDYGPDRHLDEVGKSVGLEGMQWPIKSTVSINFENQSVEATSISVRNGYAAEPVYHYPLKDGRWLICRLSGSDVQKVIDLLHAGPSQEYTANPLGLEVR